MKNSNNSLRIFATALVTLCGVAVTSVTHAAETSPVSVKYIGSLNSAPVFQLTLTNEQTATYEITIVESDNVIYKETISGKEQVRKFQFVNNGTDEETLNVSVKNVSTKQVITYRINPATNVEVEKDLVASL